MKGENMALPINTEVQNCGNILMNAARNAHNAPIDEWHEMCLEVQFALQHLFDAAVAEAVRRVRLDKGT